MKHRNDNVAERTGDVHASQEQKALVWPVDGWQDQRSGVELLCSSGIEWDEAGKGDDSEGEGRVQYWRWWWWRYW